MKLLLPLLLACLARTGFTKKQFRLPTSRSQLPSLIVGGEPAPAGRYPYFAGLKVFATSIPFCGGVLIAPNLVLTAAHCGPLPFVNIGCQDFSNQSAPGCEVFEVAQFFVSPGFNLNLHFAIVQDYAVIVLNGTSRNKPIDFLPSRNFTFEVQQLLTTIEVGNTFSGGNGSHILLQVDVGFVPRAECDTSNGLSWMTL